MSRDNIDKEATLSFVLKLVRMRILQTQSSLDKASRLVGYISGHYHDTKTTKIKSINTEEKVLYEGSDFILPYKSNSGLQLQAISFHYFQIDGTDIFISSAFMINLHIYIHTYIHTYMQCYSVSICCSSIIFT